MKVSLPIAALLLLSTVAFATTPTPPPMIIAISPTSGPASGGTTVVILGQNLDIPPNFACILPCPTKVVFDTIEVEPVVTTQTRLDVKTPPHAEGVVDITIKTGDGRTLTAPAGFRYTASGEAGYQTILLPIYTDGNVTGANGSVWKTDLWLRNNGAEEITLAPGVCPPGQACLTVFPLTYSMKPGETLHNLPAFFQAPGPNPARLLYATSGRLSGDLRIADTSRASLNAGTELPLVRERDLQAEAIQLHNVPLDSHFRVMLRIYDVALTESRFKVNFYPEDAGQSPPAISSIELTATTSDSGAFRLHPAWTQYGALTDLLSQPTTQPVQLRAEIVPLTPGGRFWAFISLTNNETQHVTLITPQ